MERCQVGSLESSSAPGTAVDALSPQGDVSLSSEWEKGTKAVPKPHGVGQSCPDALYPCCSRSGFQWESFQAKGAENTNV